MTSPCLAAATPALPSTNGEPTLDKLHPMALRSNDFTFVAVIHALNITKLSSVALSPHDSLLGMRASCEIGPSYYASPVDCYVSFIYRAANYLSMTLNGLVGLHTYHARLLSSPSNLVQDNCGYLEVTVRLNAPLESPLASRSFNINSTGSEITSHHCPEDCSSSSVHCTSTQSQCYHHPPTDQNAFKSAYFPLDELHKHPHIKQLESLLGIEVCFLPDSVFRRHKRLAVFDMDSTLIKQEVIDELARAAGPSIQEKVEEITKKAMSGDLDFDTALRERAALLQGLPVSILDNLKENITLTNGATELITTLRKLGCRTALLSGGFISVARWLADKLGMDYVFANELDRVHVHDGLCEKKNCPEQVLSGKVNGTIVNSHRKCELLQILAKQENLTLAQTLAVGDGANDLLMLNKAGLGIAFNAKPKVQRTAPARLNSNSLLHILYFLGFTEKEVIELNNVKSTETY